MDVGYDDCGMGRSSFLPKALNELRRCWRVARVAGRACAGDGSAQKWEERLVLTEASGHTYVQYRVGQSKNFRVRK